MYILQLLITTYIKKYRIYYVSTFVLFLPSVLYLTPGKVQI